MTPLEQARADLETACTDFNNAANQSTPPDQLERAVRRLMEAVLNWADTRRETRREQ